MSPITSVMASGRAALESAEQQLSQDAQQIANPTNENAIDPLLDSGRSLLAAQAGADVIRTSNEMIGTLLDVFA